MNHEVECLTGFGTDFLFRHLQFFHQFIYVRRRGSITDLDTMKLAQDTFFHFGSSLIGKGYSQNMSIGIRVAYQVLYVFHRQGKGFP